MPGIFRKRSEVEGTFLEAPIFAIQEKDEEGNWEITEGLWFTHDEARMAAERVAYRLGEWRVCSFPAKGRLRNLLAEHTVEGGKAEDPCQRGLFEAEV